MFAYHVLIATNISEYVFDLEVKVQIKYFLKSVLRLLTQTPHSCIDGVPSYLAQ